MPPTTPRYLLVPSGVPSEMLAERLASLGPFAHEGTLDEILSPGGPGAGRPGWVVVPPGVDPGEVVGLLTRLGSEPGEWSPLLVGESGGVLHATPLAPGFRMGVNEVGEKMERAASEPSHLSVRMAMKATSRLRHDINNPLTAALAEVQLLLMDVEENSPLEQVLRGVEGQLRRIGELVGGFASFRAPK